MKPGIGLIGRKLGMSTAFQEDGSAFAVTILKAGPCTVVQAKTKEKDGYRAVKLGFEEVAPERLRKPLTGYFAKRQLKSQRILREFRLPEEGGTGQGELPAPEKTGTSVEGKPLVPTEGQPEDLPVGSLVTVDLFKVGDRVDVTGISRGLGFQGGVKRWHWKGGPKTHGSMSHRAPGSIGSTTDPGRVWRGHHLPGHMGHRRVTVQGLEVFRVDSQQNLLLIKGAVPGHEQSMVLIRKSRKPPKALVKPAVPAKKKAAVPKAAAPAAKAAAKAAPPKEAAKPQEKPKAKE